MTLLAQAIDGATQSVAKELSAWQVGLAVALVVISGAISLAEPVQGHGLVVKVDLPNGQV